MIDKLTYDQVLAISKELSNNAQIIDKIAQERNIQDLQDFSSTVEGYSKFLETIVNMNKDADNALQDLIKMKN